MTKPARYAVTFGLAGCYMPDAHSGAIQFSTRKDLAEYIKDELRLYEMPVSLFKEVRIRKLWRHIQARDSSVAHFHLDHKGYRLSFQGLTQEEYNQSIEE